MGNGRGYGGFSLLGYILGRALGDQPVEENVPHTDETQVGIPQAQTWHAGLGAAVLALLYVAAWALLPRPWASGASWGLTALLFIAMSAWGARAHHGDSRAIDTIREYELRLLELFAVLLFAPQFWAFLAPIAVGVITYLMMGLSYEWWETYWYYMVGIAVACGPATMAIMRLYLYSRETVVRFEMTPWQRQLLRAIMPAMPDLIAKETGVQAEPRTETVELIVTLRYEDENGDYRKHEVKKFAFNDLQDNVKLYNAFLYYCEEVAGGASPNSPYWIAKDEHTGKRRLTQTQWEIITGKLADRGVLYKDGTARNSPYAVNKRFGYEMLKDIGNLPPIRERI